MQNFIKTIVNALQAWTRKNIKASTADWNENNPNADNYVKNRPFYEERCTKIVDEVLVDNLTNEDYSNGNIPSCNFITGEKYNVIWNDTLYENLVCFYKDGYNIIASSDKYPFYIDDDGGNSLFVDSDESEWTLSIFKSTEKEVEIIHKLDSKFLPEYVATKEYVDKPKSNIILSDEINGYNYIVAVRNGNLISYPITSSISLDSVPNKMQYFIGDPFIPDGMVITAYGVDGSTREISNYTYDKVITEENLNNFVITYTENNNIFTTSINLSLPDFSLIDFNYTVNADGTYTLTSWKGTYNGEPSTKIIVPNSEYIVI